MIEVNGKRLVTVQNLLSSAYSHKLQSENLNFYKMVKLCEF